jgi:DNA-binding response OmpR family regulator
MFAVGSIAFSIAVGRVCMPSSCWGGQFDLVRTGCERAAKIGVPAASMGETVLVRAVSDSAMPLVLVVEDEPEIAALMRDFLEADGFGVLLAVDAEEAVDALRTAPDCVLLDVMLPGASGFDLCRDIRSASDVPVLFLSARGGDADKLRGLGLGADDYIVKSVTPAEVVARVKAVLRRSGAGRGLGRLRFGSLEVDLAAHEVHVAGRLVRMTAREFELLRVFVQHPRQVFSREHLFELVWGSYGDRSAVSVYISRVREKIGDDPADPRYIVTVWGAGYRFDGGLAHNIAG